MLLYGHRNPQGMVYDAATNRIWSVEHSPKGGDELNLIQKGKNYGWPKTSYGINYDGSVLTKFKEMEGVENPVRYWVPSIGPCGMTIVTSDKYPDRKGNLLISGLPPPGMSSTFGCSICNKGKVIPGYWPGPARSPKSGRIPVCDHRRPGLTFKTDL